MQRDCQIAELSKKQIPILAGSQIYHWRTCLEWITICDEGRVSTVCRYHSCGTFTQGSANSEYLMSPYFWFEWKHLRVSRLPNYKFRLWELFKTTSSLSAQFYIVLLYCLKPKNVFFGWRAIENVSVSFKMSPITPTLINKRLPDGTMFVVSSTVTLV